MPIRDIGRSARQARDGRLLRATLRRFVGCQKIMRSEPPTSGKLAPATVLELINQQSLKQPAFPDIGGQQRNCPELYAPTASDAFPVVTLFHMTGRCYDRYNQNITTT